MPIDLQILCRQIQPDETVLLFGAGSSIPSGGLSAQKLAERIATKFDIDCDPSLTLSEISTIVEKQNDRKSLVTFLRSLITPLTPTGGILNLPYFNWKSLYTTNYDQIIEKSYYKKGKECFVCSSNFDFQIRDNIDGVQLFKLHGTIENDICDGHNSRLVITTIDYDLTDKYRELLYDSFKLHVSSGNVLIIGYSLSDPDLRSLIDEALRRKRESGAQGKIYLLLYKEDKNRALIYEDRGMSVCFATLDDLFSALTRDLPQARIAISDTDDPLDNAPMARASTIDVAHATAAGQQDLVKMFNGRPATYADIVQGWTFERECASRIEAQLANDQARIAYVLGAAGVGKSTAARQALVALSRRGVLCWEHNPDMALPTSSWIKVDDELRKKKNTSVLFIDDAHDHMREINTLVDQISRFSDSGLKLILVSTHPHWNPRVKSPAIFTNGNDYSISSLSESEITLLLDLLDNQPDIRALVEERFLGFSRAERRRRLVDRCSADMFVCLKNIFGFQSINSIILQEYADLDVQYQDVYRTISALENAGVRVHRQLVIRALGINANSISSMLNDLQDILGEYTISEKLGLYGWKVRHSVIAKIITDYKFDNQNELFDLFENIVSFLNPTYQIELRSIRDICDIHDGIGKLTDKNKQNYLLRRMISMAPGERVPRHRLIWNLIEQGEIEQAENEIRIFEKELRLDGPVHRYKIKLQLKLASDTSGIMDSDRAVMISRAASMAEAGVADFPDDKSMYRSYCEVGVAYLRLTGDWKIYDSALSKAREAEARILDPDLRRIITTYENLGYRLQSGGSSV